MLRKTVKCLSFTVKCKDNQHFSECGNNCGKICYEEETAGCDKLCDIGCFCNEGYFLYKTNGTCIPAQNCTLSKCMVPGYIATI